MDKNNLRNNLVGDIHSFALGDFGKTAGDSLLKGE